MNTIWKRLQIAITGGRRTGGIAASILAVLVISTVGKPLDLSHLPKPLSGVLDKFAESEMKHATQGSPLAAVDSGVRQDPDSLPGKEIFATMLCDPATRRVGQVTITTVIKIDSPWPTVCTAVLPESVPTQVVRFIVARADHPAVGDTMVLYRFSISAASNTQGGASTHSEVYFAMKE